MTLTLAALAVGALVVAWLVTRTMCRAATALGFVAIPNVRSSHARPTPRAGGVGIVVAASGAFSVLAAIGELPVDLFHALVTGGFVVALVGLVDDRTDLSPIGRFTVHFLVAGWVVAWLHGFPSMAGEPADALSWLKFAALVLGVVWVLNLFNFMDGIDGLAGSEAAFVAIGSACIAGLTGLTTPATGLGVLVGASCLGFLAWNWQPARIFMGDVGSGYLGYLLAVLALVAARDEPVWLWVWLVLGAVFVVDATVTLVVRVLHGERPWVAHRNHAYQKLARRWGSHARVTSAVLLANVFWLLPAAALVAIYPQWAPLVASLVIGPLLVLALFIGAGRPES